MQSTPCFYMRSSIISMSRFRSMAQSPSTNSMTTQQVMSTLSVPQNTRMNDLSFSKSAFLNDNEDSVLSDQITITKTIDKIEQETISESYDYSMSDDLQESKSSTKPFRQMIDGNVINQEQLQQKIKFTGFDCFQDPSILRNLVQQIK